MMPAPSLDQECFITDSTGQNHTITLGGPWTKSRLQDTLAIIETQPGRAGHDLCQLV
mgnify:FL=1